MLDGVTGKHTVSRLGRAQAELVPSQNFKENVEDIYRIEDQGVFTCLGRRIHKGQEGATFRAEEGSKEKGAG